MGRRNLMTIASALAFNRQQYKNPFHLRRAPPSAKHIGCINSYTRNALARVECLRVVVVVAAVAAMASSMLSSLSSSSFSAHCFCPSLLFITSSVFGDASAPAQTKTTHPSRTPFIVNKKLHIFNNKNANVASVSRFIASQIR